MPRPATGRRLYGFESSRANSGRGFDEIRNSGFLQHRDAKLLRVVKFAASFRARNDVVRFFWTPRQDLAAGRFDHRFRFVAQAWAAYRSARTSCLRSDCRRSRPPVSPPGELEAAGEQALDGVAVLLVGEEMRDAGSHNWPHVTHGRAAHFHQQPSAPRWNRSGARILRRGLANVTDTQRENEAGAARPCVLSPAH